MRVNSSTFFLQHYCHFCPFHNFQSSPLIKLILLSINLSSEKAGEQKAAFRSALGHFKKQTSYSTHLHRIQKSRDQTVLIIQFHPNLSLRLSVGYYHGNTHPSSSLTGIFYLVTKIDSLKYLN